MNYRVDTIATFDKQARKLSKRYPSLKSDLQKLITTLENDPKHGKSLGSNFYKIRLAISSKQKGKSGGARVITFVKIVDSIVLLVSIYDKSEHSTISSAELDLIFKQLN